MLKIGTFLVGGTLPEGVWMVSSWENSSYGQNYGLVGVSSANQGKTTHRYPDWAGGIHPEGLLGGARVVQGSLSFTEKE